MQRQRNMYEIFPELVDLNQGPSFNVLDTSGSDECRFAPTSNERRLVTTEITGEKIIYSNWDVGESSSTPSVQNHATNNNNNNWSASFGTHERAVGPVNLLNASSDDVVVMDVDLNLEYEGQNERGAGGSFGNNQVRSSLIVNSQEPTNRESSRRYFDERSTNSSQRLTQQPPSMNSHGIPGNLLPFPFLYGSSRSGNSSSSGVAQERSNVNHIAVENFLIPNLNAPTDDDQMLNDVPPWNIFPNLETGFGEHRGHIRRFPSGPSSSSVENVLSSGGRNQPCHHQPSLRLEIPDENALGADIDGRNRFLSEVRQILSVLRRGENFNPEEYMLVDPVLNGIANLHDTHRDMRLDVDNMSYEELLALEESIGNVKTGLTEEVILRSLKQRKYFSFMAIATQNFEPCCICQEEYNNGDDIGALDCGHEFHTGCIKQWLTQKNLCPICKMPGLSA